MRKKLALLMRHCMLPKLSAVTVITDQEQQKHYTRTQLHERIKELAAAEGIFFTLDEGNGNGQEQEQASAGNDRN